MNHVGTATLGYPAERSSAALPVDAECVILLMPFRACSGSDSNPNWKKSSTL